MDRDRTVGQDLEARASDPKQAVESPRGEAVYASFGGSIAPPKEPGASLARNVGEAADILGDTVAVTPEARGRYRFAETAEIGRGGIGKVLVAFDQHLGREVAVKELLSDTSSLPRPSSNNRSTALEGRFLREARLTGQLEHPGIVPVYELGRRDDGTYYYTMKLVRGRTLATALRQCRTPAERLKLLPHYADLCHAIAYAHSRGVIHRDIKTENVMVGEFGETVVLDWGLAKAEGTKDIRGGEMERDLRLLYEADAGKTVAGSALGTPAYMSPEQADGAIDEIDERSDVWSLGAVLFEILTGRPPFEGVMPFEIVGKVLRDDVPSVRGIEPEAPPELEAVAAKALQRDKAERYQAARELADETDAYMSGKRVAAYQYSSWELLKGFWAKNRALSLAVVGIAGLVAASSVGLLHAYRRAENERSIAAHNSDQARRNELKAEFNLAFALQEKADELFEERVVIASRIYSAAALVHHPCELLGLRSAGDCDARFPGGSTLRTRAASNVYQTTVSGMVGPGRGLVNGSGVNQLEVSADGRVAVAALADDRVRVWDLREGKSLATLGVKLDARRYRSGPGQLPIALSPDGGTIALCASGGEVSLWKTSGEPLGALVTQGNGLCSLAYSPDGRHLALSTGDGTIAIWDTSTRERVRTLDTGRPGSVNPGFSRSGRLLAAWAPNRLLLWDITTGTSVGAIEGIRTVGRFTFTLDDRLIAVPVSSGSVEIVDVESARLVRSLPGHQGSVTGVSFTPDGALMATSGYDGQIRILDGHTFELLEVFNTTLGSNHVRCLPDGTGLVSAAGWTGVLRIRRLERNVPTFPVHTNELRSLDFSPEGELLASCGGGGTVRLWEVRSRRERWTHKTPEARCTSVSFSPDSTKLASVATSERGSTITVQQAAGGRVLQMIDEPQAYAAVFSPDGRLLASHSIQSRTTKLWEADSGKLLRVLETDGGEQNFVAFSPDGRWLATAGFLKDVRLFDVATGKLWKTLETSRRQNSVYSLAFSSNGRWMASGTIDGTILLWDTKTWSSRQLANQDLPGKWVNTLSFIPGDKLLASAGDDGVVRLWSMETGQNVFLIKARSYTHADVTPDGKRLAVADGNQIKLYAVDMAVLEADPARLLETAEREAGMKLEGFGLTFEDK